MDRIFSSVIGGGLILSSVLFGLAACTQKVGKLDSAFVYSSRTMTLEVACWHGMTFMEAGSGSLIQVMDSTGKPLECDK